MNERRGFLLGVIFLFGFIGFLMLKPYSSYIMGAMILAFILRRPHFVLRQNLGSRSSAFLVTISSIILAVLPLIIAGVAVADDARDLVSGINQTNIVVFDDIEEEFEQITGSELDVEGMVSSALSVFNAETLGGFSQAVSIFTEVVIGISIMLFLTYYFLKDGERFMDWAKKVSPLPRQMEDNLTDKLALTTSAVLKGHIMVAIAQGLIAGVGLAIFGVPNSLFWTFMMVILGVIPVVGSSLIWVPASVYLAITGNVISGVMLALYGMVVVGATDNLMRPLVVDEEADLHPAVIILGVLGGVSVFGITGLFIGPIAFGVLKSVLSVFMESYRDL